MKRLRARVNGRVQGVGFRYFVLHVAQVRGLKGYTRNLEDGGVEVVAEAEAEDLEWLLRELEAGPSQAHVTGVQVSWSEATGEFREFGIRATGWS